MLGALRRWVQELRLGMDAQTSLLWRRAPLQTVQTVLLDGSAFKVPLLDQSAHLRKRKTGGGSLGEPDVIFSELKQEQTSRLVQIKAGIFHWASGNWALVKRQTEHRMGGGMAAWSLEGHGTGNAVWPRGALVLG